MKRRASLAAIAVLLLSWLTTLHTIYAAGVIARPGVEADGSPDRLLSSGLMDMAMQAEKGLMPFDDRPHRRRANRNHDHTAGLHLRPQLFIEEWGHIEVGVIGRDMEVEDRPAHVGDLRRQRVDARFKLSLIELSGTVPRCAIGIAERQQRVSLAEIDDNAEGIGCSKR